MSNLSPIEALPSTSSRAGFKRLIGSTLIAATLISTNIFAADMSEITRLLRSGKHAQAMQLVDEALKREPTDPQLRFTKGVLLTEQKRTQDAIEIFLKLSEDHPELPEPYNNLAVLYSQDNQFEKARAALNMAIKTNSSYATAYENLGDVHARMAAQSYGKALNLNNESTGVQSKLKVLTALGIRKPDPIAAPAPAPAPAPVTKQAVPVTPTGIPAQANAPAAAPAPASAVVAKSAGSATAVAVASSVAPAPVPVKTQIASALPEDDVLIYVDKWVKAWSSKDMDAYVDAYDNTYVGNGAKNHAQWVKMRELRIVGKDSIDITIEKPIVELKGDKAVVSFRQVYVGGAIRSDGMKTLTLEKKSGQWKIIKEVSEV